MSKILASFHVSARPVKSFFYRTRSVRHKLPTYPNGLIKYSSYAGE